MINEEEELKATAYHEAGHAIAAILLNVPFEYVTINSYAEAVERIVLGHIIYEQAFIEKLNDKCKQFAEAEYEVDEVDIARKTRMILAAAGHYSQKKHTGKDDFQGAARDRDVIFKFSEFSKDTEE